MLLCKKNSDNVNCSALLCPAPNRRGIKRCFCLTSVCLTSGVCLSVAYIGRTQKHRKTKIGTEVAHTTHDSDTTFRVKRTKDKVTRPLCSPPCWHVRRLQRWAWKRVGSEKLLLRCSLVGGAKRFGAPRGRRGAGHTVAAACLQLVSAYIG